MLANDQEELRDLLKVNRDELASISHYLYNAKKILKNNKTNQDNYQALLKSIDNTEEKITYIYEALYGFQQNERISKSLQYIYESTQESKKTIKDIEKLIFLVPLGALAGWLIPKIWLSIVHFFS
jgi:uncharacterized protein (DUF1697 family)